MEEIEKIETEIHRIKSLGKEGIQKENKKIDARNAIHRRLKMAKMKKELKQRGENKKTIKGYIYFAKCGNYIKIGLTSNSVKSRINGLQVGSPEPVLLLHSIKSSDIRSLEGFYHKKFKNKRVQGEWFRLSEEDITEIKSQGK